MNRRLLLLPLLLVLSGVASAAEQPKKKAAANPAFAAVTDTPGLPRVLLLGDSISIGYTLDVRAILKGAANVHRPATNCSSTSHGLAHLDAWLGAGKWDVIHFNFGIHDAKLPPEGVRHAPLDVYERNLRELVRRLRATGAKLVWASSTPIPNGGVLAPDRRFGDITTYNAVAAKVMREMGVATNDLHAAVAPRFAQLARAGDLHYTAEGSALLAQHVAASVRAQIGAR
ncbi:MAG: SGNH/GDSL hydrolase family protein [Opitutaceae bacterium]|nr:SGNH/GDSL hydrolase family protein [Opitutaceae bacterium]